MLIIVVGAGKVGYAITEQLVAEGHDVTLIDKSVESLRNSNNILDVRCIEGNASSRAVLEEAGIKEADLFISATSSDETNIILSLIARKMGAKNTIARVRNPEYSEQIRFLRDDLNLSMTINPEMSAALEIAKILRTPSAIKVDSFARGRIDLIEWRVRPNGKLDGVRLLDFYTTFRIKLLICAVIRNNEIIIPTGSFVLNCGDRIFITASPRDIMSFFRMADEGKNKVRNVMIVGGGRIAFYLSKQLESMGMKAKIIERSEERCQELCSLLNSATIINADGTDHELLREEGIDDADAFIAITNIDEVNIILGLFAAKRGVHKVITKITRLPAGLVEDSDLETIITPQELTGNQVVQYVRAMQNSMGSGVETLYKLLNGRLEALEFRVRKDYDFLGIPLKDLRLKKNLLVACIYRNNKVIVPGGNDCLMKGDSVIVVTTGRKLQEFADIVEG